MSGTSRDITTSNEEIAQKRQVLFLAGENFDRRLDEAHRAATGG